MRPQHLLPLLPLFPLIPPTSAAPSCQPLPCCHCCSPLGPCADELCFPESLECCPSNWREGRERCMYWVEPLRLEQGEVERMRQAALVRQREQEERLEEERREEEVRRAGNQTESTGQPDGPTGAASGEETGTLARSARR